MNRDQLNWYIGKIVFDSLSGKTGIVISHPASWTDQDGQHHTWDFNVLYEDGELTYADYDELKVVTNGEIQKG
jgi:hypothetical protein